MAAIDKLYVKGEYAYMDFNELRIWAIAYYPQLLFYFYNYALTYKEYQKNRNDYIKHQKIIAKAEYKKIRGDSSYMPENLIKYYKKSAGYDCPEQQAVEEVNAILKEYRKTEYDWEMSYEFPVMNTPCEVDRKLKWICPVPCVREYLEKQCGVKTKWYHKLFWRGKKHFKE